MDELTQMAMNERVVRKVRKVEQVWGQVQKEERGQ